MKESITQQPAGDIKLLFVEDGQLKRKIIEYAQQKLPYKINLVSSGEDALDAVRRLLSSSPDEIPYHIIFMDHNLTGKMNGAQTIKLIKNIPGLKHNLLFVSISDQDFNEEELKTMGIATKIMISPRTITSIVNTYVLKLRETTCSQTFPSFSLGPPEPHSNSNAIDSLTSVMKTARM